MSLRRSAALAVLVLVLSASAAYGAPPGKPNGRSSAALRSDNRSKPIVFVHGLDAFGCAGNDGNGTWNNMINALTGWGWAGSKVKLGYYECDTGQSHSMNHHGSHATHFGGNGEHYTSTENTHGADTAIEHLGYHFAWYVKDHFGAACVDAVGHSMGGLIIRYGLAQSQRAAAGFPTGLCIEDIVTLGTPHTGTNWAYGCEWADQCDQMEPGHAFQDWLATNAANPQGAGGTDWTTLIADDDTVVGVASGYGMSASHKTRYTGSNDIEHSDYMHETTDARTADVEYWDSPGPWYSWLDAPWPVRWSDFALTYGSW